MRFRHTLYCSAPEMIRQPVLLSVSQPTERTSRSRFAPHQNCMTAQENNWKKTLLASIVTETGGWAETASKASLLLTVTSLQSVALLGASPNVQPEVEQSFRCNCTCTQCTWHASATATTLSRSQKVTSRIDRVAVHELRTCPACQATATNCSDEKHVIPTWRPPRKHDVRPTSKAKAGQTSLTRRGKNLSHDAQRAQS